MAELKRSQVKFVACDNPYANELTIDILVAVAADEARRISERTKAALRAYKDGMRVSKAMKLRYPNGVPQEVVDGWKLGTQKGDEELIAESIDAGHVRLHRLAAIKEQLEEEARQVEEESDPETRSRLHRNFLDHRFGLRLRRLWLPRHNGGRFYRRGPVVLCDVQLFRHQQGDHNQRRYRQNLQPEPRTEEVPPWLRFG